MAPQIVQSRASIGSIAGPGPSSLLLQVEGPRMGLFVETELRQALKGSEGNCSVCPISAT